MTKWKLASPLCFQRSLQRNARRTPRCMWFKNIFKQRPELGLFSTQSGTRGLQPGSQGATRDRGIGAAGAAFRQWLTERV